MLVSKKNPWKGKALCFIDAVWERAGAGWPARSLKVWSLQSRAEQQRDYRGTDRSNTIYFLYDPGGNGRSAATCCPETAGNVPLIMINDGYWIYTATL